jgi:hypothetical protein
VKKLGTIIICGQVWSVIEGCEKDKTELCDAWGLCDPEQYTIWIHENAAQAQKTNTLVHECLHALIACSGADFAIRSTLPRGVKS